MKWTKLLILLCGSLVSICAMADDAKGTHSRWIITLTLTDTASGKLVEQGDLDAELEFDDAIKCESILARVRPIPVSGNLAVALTCRKVDRNVVDPRWGIVVTVTDTTTGELLEQHELDPEFEYNDPVKCQAMAARLGPIRAPTNLAAALTCRRVDRSDAESERSPPERMMNQSMVLLCSDSARNFVALAAYTGENSCLMASRWINYGRL